MEADIVAFSVQAILGITILVDVCLLLFVFKKRNGGIMYRLLALHIFGILCWSVSVFLLLLDETPIWAACAFASAVLLAVTKYLFTLAFPENVLPKRSFHYMALLFAVITFIVSFVPGAFFKELKVIDGYYVTVENGPLALLYSIIIAYLLISPIHILWKKYRMEKYDARIQKQLYYLCVGTTVFFFVGLATNSVLPVIFDIFFFNGLGPSFSLILAGFIVYIISQHNFLQIRRALQLSFIYSLLLFLIVSLYATIIALLGMLAQRYTEAEIIFSAGITTVLGIFGVPYIDRYLRKKTDSFFFKDHYNYADALYMLSETVNRSLRIEDITHVTSESLKDIYKAESAHIGFAPQVKTAGMASAAEKTTLEAPIILNNTHIGSIFLGEKRSGEAYTEEDGVLLKTFSHQIAVALENARLYKEIFEYSAGLEKRVEERTEEIRSLQKHQSHMILDISHKLQSPLTIIKGEVGMLRKHVPEHSAYERFEQSVDDMSAFIYDLLTLARLEAVPLETKERADISTLALELVEYFETVATHTGITLRSSIEPNIYLICDKKKMSELFTNLVSNAMKYMRSDAAEKCISVTLAVQDEMVVCTVRDTGMGIDPQDLSHIFDRFYRASKTRTSSIQGTGLGLAICKKIVEIHNGTIAVASEPGNGTVFTIRIPQSS